MSRPNRLRDLGYWKKVEEWAAKRPTEKQVKAREAEKERKEAARLERRRLTAGTPEWWAEHSGDKMPRTMVLMGGRGLWEWMRKHRETEERLAAEKRRRALDRKNMVYHADDPKRRPRENNPAWDNYRYDPGAVPRGEGREDAGFWPAVEAYYEWRVGMSPPRQVSGVRASLRRYGRWAEAEGVDLSPGWVARVTSREVRAAFVRCEVERGLSPVSVNNEIKALRALVAYQTGERVPAGVLGPVREPHRPVRYFRADALRALFDAPVPFIRKNAGKKRGGKNSYWWCQPMLDARDLLMVEVMYSTGMRVGELPGLEWGDIDVEGGTARIRGKGGRDRVVYFGDALRAKLMAYGELYDAHYGGRCGHVFRRPSGRTYTGPRGLDHLKALVRRALWAMERAAGFPERVRAHDLRRSFASNMLEAGAPISEVSVMLGHASVKTTQRYATMGTPALVRAYNDAHPRASRMKVAMKGYSEDEVEQSINPS